ncbi:MULTISPECIES: MucBP domain-containing protein [Bacillus]|nr:MucBP domain-containing protein [Bacillus cereus]AQQ64320.1 internalin-J [Bacillus cereus]OBZ63980.1 cell surface protein [Bacillus cereus]SMD94126.1 Internalin-J precursor [Bacillus cereus]
MDKFNIFKVQYNAFNDMLSLAGEEVFVNGEKKHGIITNTDTREFNDKYISTDFPMMRGDYIYYNNMYWMIWNQVTVPRAENYKGIMRQAEHDVIFNLYYAGVTSKYLLKCPAIIQRTSDYTTHYQSTVSMVTVDSEIHVFVRDTPSTRRIINLVGNGDGEIVLGERNYDIIGVSIEKKGYLNITCRLGIRNDKSDYVNNIYWSSSTSKPADWESQIDDTFYQRGSVIPYPKGTVTVKHVNESNVEIAPSDSLTGNVGSTYTTSAKTIDGYTLKTTPANATGIYINGTINVEYIYEVTVVQPSLPTGDELTDVTALSYNSSIGKIKWTPEVKKDDFYGFWGYRVTYEYEDWGSPTQDVYNVTKEEIGGILISDPSNKVYIESVFKDGATTVYMKKKIYTATEITSLPNI